VGKISIYPLIAPIKESLKKERRFDNNQSIPQNSHFFSSFLIISQERKVVNISCSVVHIGTNIFGKQTNISGNAIYKKI